MTVPRFKKFKIEAYKPGKSNIAKIQNIIKLSANESALGVSPRVKKILQNKELLIVWPQSNFNGLSIIKFLMFIFLFINNS